MMCYHNAHTSLLQVAKLQTIQSQTVYKGEKVANRLNNRAIMPQNDRNVFASRSGSW